jgi:tetratricopeptide (TPR) repeat protein
MKFANVVYYLGIEMDMYNHIWDRLPRDREAIELLGGTIAKWTGDILFKVAKNGLEASMWGGRPIWAAHYELYDKEYKWDEEKLFRERREYFEEMLKTKDKFEQLLLKFYETAVKEFKQAIEENKDNEMEVWLMYMTHLLNPLYIAMDKIGGIRDYWLQSRFEVINGYTSRKKVMEKTRDQPPLVREVLKNPAMFKLFAPRFGIELEDKNKNQRKVGVKL